MQNHLNSNPITNPGGGTPMYGGGQPAVNQNFQHPNQNLPVNDGQVFQGVQPRNRNDRVSFSVINFLVSSL